MAKNKVRKEDIRRVLNQMLDIGYADAAATVDGQDLCDDTSDAELAVELKISKPRHVRSEA